MKRRSDRYKKGTRAQYILIASIAGLLVVSGTKVVHIMQKVNLVNKGLELYEHKTWMEAEETMQQTKSYTWFRYKEKDVDNVLQELDWITNYKYELDTLYKEIKQSELDKDYAVFSEARRSYEALGFHKLEEWKQEYLLENYPVHEAIHSAWVSFKGYMQSLLNNPSQSNNYNWAKGKIFEVPEQYFSSDKEEAILKLFKNCDYRLYESITLHFNQLVDTFEAFNEIYETNEKYGYKTEWLTEGVKSFIKENLLKEAKATALDEAALEEIRKQPKVYKMGESIETSLPIFVETETQIKAFSNSIKAYREQIHEAYRDEQIEEIVNDFLKNKEREIDVLVTAHYYEEAISWYRALKTLKDYSQEIEELKRLKIYEEPERLLASKESLYPFYQIGENALKADKYMVAINTQNASLEIYRFVGGPKQYISNQISVYLVDVGLENIDYSLIEQVSVSEDLILLELPEGEYQRVKVIQVGEEKIQAIFDISGETIKVSSDLKSIEVQNPIGEESPSVSIYQYDGAGYRKQEQEVVTVSLGDETLQTRIGEVVQFECYYPEAFQDENVTVYNFEGQTYFFDQGAYLNLQEDIRLTEGRYRIIGEIVGVSTQFDDALQTEVTRPIIKVLQVEQG